MRINDLSPSGLNGLSPGGVSPASDAGSYGRGGGYGQSSDQVQLSGGSRLAATALADHSARLALLRNLVAGGNYAPSVEEVGRSIVKEALAGAQSSESYGD